MFLHKFRIKLRHFIVDTPFPFIICGCTSCPATIEIFILQIFINQIDAEIFCICEMSSSQLFVPWGTLKRNSMPPFVG